MQKTHAKACFLAIKSEGNLDVAIKEMKGQIFENLIVKKRMGLGQVVGPQGVMCTKEVEAQTSESNRLVFYVQAKSQLS